MQYDLVLEGGGAKSIAFVGALQEFESQGHTIGRLLGTSAGGITAALLACGYTSQEALAIIYDPQAQRLTFTDALIEAEPLARPTLRAGALRALLGELDAPLLPNWLEDQADSLLWEVLLQLPSLRPLFSFLERGHWYTDHGFFTWLARLLDNGWFRGKPRRFSQMTLEEFYQATDTELSLVVSNVSDARVLILNHRTTPDCPLVSALRMTAGLPMLWPDTVWQDKWGAYLDQSITGHHIVDGEFFSSFPIELFFSDLPQVKALVGEKQTPHVLGLLIDESLPVPGAPPPIDDARWAAMGRLPPVDSIRRLYDAVLQVRDKLTIEAIDQHIVRLPAKGYQMLEFDLPTARFDALVLAGKKALQRYFAQQATRPSQGGMDGSQATPQSMLQFINGNAQQQLFHMGVVNNYHIHTGGGSYIDGNVDTNGGTFTGRDSLSVADGATGSDAPRH